MGLRNRLGSALGVLRHPVSRGFVTSELERVKDSLQTHETAASADLAQATSALLLATRQLEAELRRWRALGARRPRLAEVSRVVDEFHRSYYEAGEVGRTWKSTTYLGHITWKMPSDLWLYADILFEVRPGLLVETGTAFGGSALYYAHVMDQLGAGKVVTIDRGPQTDRLPEHPRIQYLTGHSSTDAGIVAEVQRWASWTGGPVLVSLDSDHRRDHVLAELNAYAELVTPGSYLVVEDTNVNGHPVYPEFGPGPAEALEAWLPSHADFEIDHDRSAQFLFSMHTFLKRR